MKTVNGNSVFFGIMKAELLEGNSRIQIKSERDETYTADRGGL